MISRRYCPEASALGRKKYVRNSLQYGERYRHWGEVFDPADGKWEAVPNPPIDDQGIIICAAVGNPERIIVAYEVPGDPSSA